MSVARLATLRFGMRPGCLSSRQYGGKIVLFAHNTSQQRTFSVSRSLNVSLKERRLTEMILPLQDGRIAGTIYIPNPSQTDQSKIIDQLPQAHSLWTKNSMTVFFMATPGLARWFDPKSEFYEKAVNHVFGTSNFVGDPDSVVAIVDGLPSPGCFENSQLSTEKSRAGGEGFTYLLIRKQDSSSTSSVELSGGRTVSSNTSEQGEQQQLVRFHSMTFEAEDQSDLYMASLSLPVSNTLFVNGSRGTLFRQIWSKSAETQSRWAPISPSPITLSTYNAPVFKSPQSLVAAAAFDLTPLTPPREVILSMGNVLRQLQGDDGRPLGASAELEKVVPEFRKKMIDSGTDSELQIFATVVPQTAKLFPRPDHQKKGSYSFLGTAKSYSQHSEAKRHNLGLVLWNGARIHRVTSGGGGWGKKAGLLSLEPATNFDPVGDASESSLFAGFLDTGDRGTEESISNKDADLAPVGSRVQFFAALVKIAENIDFNISDHEAADILAQKQPYRRSYTVAVGTTLPHDESSNTRPTTDAAAESKFLHLPNALGMLSEGGLCMALYQAECKEIDSVLSVQDFKPVHEHRLDLPSVILRSMRDTVLRKSDGKNEDKMENSPPASADPASDKAKESRKPKKMVPRKKHLVRFVATENRSSKPTGGALASETRYVDSYREQREGQLR